MTLLDDLYNILLRPIVEAAKAILNPILEAVNKDRVVAESTEADKDYKTKKATSWRSFKPGSPLTPEEARSQTESYMAVMEPHISAQYMTMIAIETATVGQVDMSLQGLTQLPYFQDDVQNLTMAHRAEFVEGVYPALQRYQRKRFTPIIPETYRLALAVSKGILDQNKYYEAMAESGLSQEWAYYWQEQNYIYPPLSQLAELYWRGIITDTTFTMMMQRNGFRPDVVEYLKALRELIPPAGDLVTMVVREAFDPRYVVSAPSIFAEYMAKKGFTGEWADRYWTAHFLPMAVQQAYANLRRGYWDKDKFLEFLRIADIHPQWREDIYNVAFNPPTVREMGYGYDVGVYSLTDIMKYRRWGGLSVEDAEKAAIAMVAYRTEAEREAVRREYLALFAREKLTEADFRASLSELGTPPPALELWIERGRLQRERLKKPEPEREYRIVTASEAAFAFEKGLRSESWYRSTLAELDWTDSRINLAVERSKLDIAIAKEKAAEIAPRRLTIAQIRDFYRYGMIDEDGMVDELQKLDYDLSSAIRIVELIIAIEEAPKEPLELSRTDIVRLYESRIISIPDAQLPAILANIIRIEGPNSPTSILYTEFEELGYDPIDAARLTVWTVVDTALPTLRARYTKGWITPVQMFNAIIELGLPKEKANEIMETIVKAEQPERTMAERDLTKAEIVKGVKMGILNTAQGAELLQGLGYDEAEAWYILYINAVVERGDPEGYWEMRKVVETQKKARGEASKDIPDDLIMLELKLRDAKAELEKLKKEKATEEAIGAQTVKVGQLENNMRVVIAKLKL